MSLLEKALSAADAAGIKKEKKKNVYILPMAGDEGVAPFLTVEDLIVEERASRSWSLSDGLRGKEHDNQRSSATLVAPQGYRYAPGDTKAA